jgi:hypothetical protein
MLVKFTLSIGTGQKQEEIMEFLDEMTKEELEQAWQDWSSNYIDGGYHILETQ